MPKEIERKFLVNHTRFLEGIEQAALTQGYLQPGRYSLRFVDSDTEGLLIIDWPDTLGLRDGFVIRVPREEYEELCERYVRDGSLNTNVAIVRVRIEDDMGFLTIKGPTVGCERDEYEYLIDVRDAGEALHRAAGPYVRKARYVVDFQGHAFQVDVFGGHLDGLVVAEVELAVADEPLELPEWIASEVTDDPRYYNSNLAQASAPPLPASVLTGIAA